MVRQASSGMRSPATQKTPPPKGSGSVYKLKGTRVRPWVAMTGKRDILGTYATSGEAVQALDAYNAQNVPLARMRYTFSDVYAKWSEAHYKEVGERARTAISVPTRKLPVFGADKSVTL